MKKPKPIGPSSDDYQAFLAKRPSIAASLKDAAPTFTMHDGYEIWRNAWLACEIEHGIRAADWQK